MSNATFGDYRTHALLDGGGSFVIVRIEEAMKVADQRLRQLHTLWLQYGRNDTLPSRHHITPETLHPWLGQLSIYEEIDGADFLIRLDGTQIVSWTGEDWTGRLVSEVDAKYGRNLLGACRAVWTHRLPLFDAAAPLFKKEYIEARRMLLPLYSKQEKRQVLLALAALPMLPNLPV
jgi:hypothetical protein